MWRLHGCEDFVSKQSSHSMHSVILGQGREHRIGVVWQDLTIVCASSEAVEGGLFETYRACSKITVLQNYSNQVWSEWRWKWLRLFWNRSKGEQQDLERDEIFVWKVSCSSKIKPRLRAEWVVSSEVCILASCFLESDEEEFSLIEVDSSKICSHPGRDPLKSIL